MGHAYAKTNRLLHAQDLLPKLVENPDIAAKLGSVGRPDPAIRTCQRVVERNRRQFRAHHDLSFYSGKAGLRSCILGRSLGTRFGL